MYLVTQLTVFGYSFHVVLPFVHAFVQVHVFPDNYDRVVGKLQAKTTCQKLKQTFI